MKNSNDTSWDRTSDLPNNIIYNITNSPTCVGASAPSSFNFQLAHQAHQNGNFELHIQPLERFINNTDFTIQRPTAIYNFNNLNM